jgi:hypothetical protein
MPPITEHDGRHSYLGFFFCQMLINQFISLESREISRLTGDILGLLGRLLDGQESLRKQIEAKDQGTFRFLAAGFVRALI